MPEPELKMTTSQEPDPVAAYLAEVQERADYSVRYEPGENDDVPRLLEAVKTAVRAHRPVDGRCCWCREPDGSRAKWPCGEYQAIAKALIGGTSG